MSVAHVFDVRRYVDDFNDAVVGAYRAGAHEESLGADPCVARSIVPPGTAAARDFSAFAPRIPEFIADRCVGCMSCGSACPDAALLAVVLPCSTLAERLDAFAESETVPARARETATARFADTRPYRAAPADAGREAAAFGLFVDPVHCKGCGECVDVCVALGHGGLRMIEKVPEGRDGEATLARYARDVRFFRTLPPTPPEYRDERVLADLMLGEHAIGYVGGAGSCPGCGQATALRMLVAATRQTHGPDGMGIVAAGGCSTSFGGTYPYDPYLVPWTSSLVENAPALALGIRARWDQAGHAARRLWVVGDDGAFAGAASSSSSLGGLLASGSDVKVLVLDTRSTAGLSGADLGRSLVARGDVFVARTTPAHREHFYRAILDANRHAGTAVVIAYGACQPAHGIADDAADRQARLAVESRAFSLFVYDPRRGPAAVDRLGLDGNPDAGADWACRPDGSVVDVVTFARSEGRFARRFAPDGTPTPELLAARDARLRSWHELQELAGIRGQEVSR